MTIPIWPVVSVGIAVLIVLVGILVALKKYQDTKSGFPAEDERTQKIHGKAATYALYIGSYFILAFLGIQLIGTEFFGLADNDAGYPLIAALLV